MKSVTLWPALALGLLLSACASTPEVRQPSSERFVSAMTALEQKLYINCSMGETKSNTVYVILRKEDSGDYTLKYKKYYDNTARAMSAACQEKDNGLTCFAKDGYLFRIDYVFTTKIFGEMTYERVKFGTDDGYSCTLGERENFRARVL